ncbi:hypothetical protein Vafri_18181 [Volvox africanus]|uniref:VASt domain-containing protein n=1 Tax=Volvox africanus TaxID=51714 RepID=A0A8J4BLI2_9CHLO|nr:hypothetical protein Vafri_18181 [Volvox africanus]
MLKAFAKSNILTPVVSVGSTLTPSSGQSNGVEQQMEHQQPAPAVEAGRNSILLNLDEVPMDGGDGASSAAAGVPVFYAGMMLRGHKGDLVRLFELPPTERLLGDFHCAMRKRVLLQGRMYIFDHYVCFYSAVFGFAKKRRMPMRTIKAVRKRKHLGFPNSLEIETNEYKEFFTSFLSREEAYQLIMKQLQDGKRQVETDDGSGVRASTDRGSFPNGGAHSRDLNSPHSTSRGRAMDGGQRIGTHGSSSIGGQLRGAGLNGERSLLTRNSGSMGDDDNDDEEDSGSVWVMEQRPAPAVASGSRHVLRTTLPGTPREFFDVVLADSAPFFEDFLDSQGNRRINLTSWKRHPQLGHVRDMTFTAPIKGAFGNWGVSHTACFQSQRFCLYSDEHIVFESSQTMTDIPYGDCFTVDQRWDIKKDPDSEFDRPMITLDLHVRVPFSNRCLFKSVIESGSVKQVQDTYSQFVEQLRPVMQERLLSQNTLGMQDPGDPVLSQTPRVNSTLGSLAARSIPLARSMQSMRAFENGEPGEGPLSGHPTRQSLRNGGEGVSEPSVGRLLLSLGGRLVEGARGVLESGVDVVLNLTQCRTTPQMRFLIALVVIMFMANSACMLGYIWHGWSGGGSSSAAGGSAGTVVNDIAAVKPLLFEKSSALSDLSTYLSGMAGLDGGAGGAATSDGTEPSGMSYWAQRVVLLHQEMQLLQVRMEVLSREVTTVVAHLTQAAGVMAGGVDAAASASAGDGRAGGEL